MFHDYPFTNLHELNLDYLMALARRALGLHLETQGNYLKLVNEAGDDISKLEVTYAQTALRDTDGHNITSYILNAGVDGNAVVLSKGNGEDVIITVPYSIRADKDVNNVELTSYIHNIEASGNQLLITLGNGTTYTVTVPFATKSKEDVNGKDLTTYVAQITTSNDKLIIKDGEGVTLSEITVPYAVKALMDVDGENIKDVYGTDLTAGTTTVQLRNKVGSVISEITVPYSVSAYSDDDGNVLKSDYGYHLGTSGNKTTIEAHDGTVLNQITVPFATIADHANNGIESVAVSGDTLVFTTYAGQTISITVPYAVKALKDNMNNTLTTSYVANAVNDTQTGKITFYAQDGSVIAEMTPTVDKAVHDSYNNTIADYVKTIVTDPNSDYVTVTHGTGTTDTLTVHYSTKAWKDTYGNVIGNVYIRSLSCITDAVTGHKVLVAYNGELSELFRIDLEAYSAVVDVNGTDITDYVKDITLSGNDLLVEHGDGTIDTITLPAGNVVDLDDLNDVSIISPTDNDILIYNGITNKFENKPTTVLAVPPIDLGSLNETAGTFTFGGIPLSVLANHIQDNYYIDVNGATHVEFFARDYSCGGASYSNLAYAIQKLDTDPSYRLEGRFSVVVNHVLQNPVSLYIYEITFHADHGDTFFTVDQVLH